MTARSNDMTPETVQIILTMIKLQRILTPAKLDHLVLSYYVPSCGLDPWPRPFVEGLKEFVSEGMKVVIEAGNKDVFTCRLMNVIVPKHSSWTSRTKDSNLIKDG